MMPPQPFAQRVAFLRPTAVNRVLQEVRQLQTEGRTLISLMRGQPDTPTPSHIIEAANKALRDGLTGYPDNRGELVLRQAVSEKLRRDNALSYDPGREILVTDGATSGLFAALGALIDPGDEVLLPDPIYDAYYSPIRSWGGRAVPVPSTIRRDRFIIDRSALEAACTPRSRVLLLNTPWNPTGTVWTRSELGECVDFALAHDLWIISDEIYEAFLYDDCRHVSPTALSPDIRARTVLVNSLSKTYAMTGWRVGYCAGAPQVIEAMLLVLQQYSRGPATFVQHAAACALREDQQCVRAMAAEFQRRRDRVYHDALRGIPGVKPLVAEGGLFVMADVRGFGMPSEDVRRFLLEQADVVVIHGSAYGVGGEGTLRISFAVGGEVLEQGLERLQKGLLRLADQTRAKGLS